MAQNVMEQIKKESESLYAAVVRTAGKKWDVISFEKESPDLSYIRVSKIKKPHEVMKVKCIFHNAKWFLVGEK